MHRRIKDVQLTHEAAIWAGAWPCGLDEQQCLVQPQLLACKTGEHTHVTPEIRGAPSKFRVVLSRFQ